MHFGDDPPQAKAVADRRLARSEVPNFFILSFLNAVPEQNILRLAFFPRLNTRFFGYLFPSNRLINPAFFPARESALHKTLEI